MTREKKSKEEDLERNKPRLGEEDELWEADPNCEHDIETLWSGIKCRKCKGWYCL